MHSLPLLALPSLAPGQTQASLAILALPNFPSLAKRASLHACLALQYTSARKKEASQHVDVERVGRRVRIRSFSAFVWLCLIA